MSRKFPVKLFGMSHGFDWDNGEHAASSAIRRRRDHLSEMAVRSAFHEKPIARDKLKRLDARYGYAAPDDLAPGDIFEG